MKAKSLFICCLLFLHAAAFSQQAIRIRITDLEKVIKESKQPTVINFWATYCLPCVEEMPYFEKQAALYKSRGLQMIFVSLDMKDDYPAKVNAFIAKRGMTNAVYWLDETNADYFCPKVDSTWSGSLPASLFINNSIGYRKFLEAEMSEKGLEKEIMAILPE